MHIAPLACGTSPASTSSWTPTGTPWFLEANVLPGLTETSIMPQAIAASGRDLGDVYAALAVAAIEEADASLASQL